MTMKISLFQFNPEWENKISNKKKITEILKKNNLTTDILIFPEMTLTGFSMNSKNLAETINSSDSIHFFSHLALNYNCDVICGIILNENNNFYNSLIHFDKQGKIKKIYRKIQLFSFSKEENFYSAGKESVITFWDDWKIGLSICYDLRFPELFRFYGKEKVDLIINIANWPTTRIKHWKILLQARAIENLCYVVGVNRVGNDPTAEYNGFSSVFNPWGEEIISVQNEENIFTIALDKEIINQVRNKFHFLDDIRLI